MPTHEEIVEKMLENPKVGAETAEVLRRKKAIAAMKKLKGSGNGDLVSVLLEERRKDQLQ